LAGGREGALVAPSCYLLIAHTDDQQQRNQPDDREQDAE
jgi:hypothetical protein